MSDLGINEIGSEREERIDPLALDNVELDAQEVEITAPETPTPTIQDFASEWAAQGPEEAMSLFNNLKKEIYESFGVIENSPNPIDVNIQTRLDALEEAVRSNDVQEIASSLDSLFDGGIDSPERLNQLAGLMLGQGGGNFEGLSIGGKNPLTEAQLRDRRENERALNAAVLNSVAESAARVAAAAAAFGEAYNKISDAYAAGLITFEEYKEQTGEAFVESAADLETEEDVDAHADAAAAAIMEDSNLSLTEREEAVRNIRDLQEQMQTLREQGLDHSNIDLYRQLDTAYNSTMTQYRHLGEKDGMGLIVSAYSGTLGQDGMTKDQLVGMMRQELEFAASAAQTAYNSAQAIVNYSETLRSDLNQELAAFVETQQELNTNRATLEEALSTAAEERQRALEMQAELEAKLAEAETAENAPSSSIEMRLYAEAGELQRELADIQQNLVNIDALIEQKQAEMALLEAEAITAQQEIDRLNEQIENFESSATYQDAISRMQIAEIQMELSEVGASYMEMLIARAPDDLSQIDADFIKQALIDAPPEIFLLSDELNRLTGNEGHNPFEALTQLAEQLPEDQRAELEQFAAEITEVREALKQAHGWQESELARAEIAMEMGGDFGVPIGNSMGPGIGVPGAISPIPAQDGSNLGLAMDAVEEALQTLAEFRAGRPLEGAELDQAIYEEAVLQAVGMDRTIDQSEINDIFTRLGMYGDELNNAQESMAAFLQDEHGITLNADVEPKTDYPEAPEPDSPEEIAARMAFQSEIQIYNDIRDEGLSSISKEELMNRLEEAGVSGEQLTISTEQLIADLQNEMGVEFVTGLNYPDPYEVSGLVGTPAAVEEEPAEPDLVADNSPAPRTDEYEYTQNNSSGPGMLT